MIKFIHCADIHLGSPMSARLPADKAAERRREVRATFGRMADYAEEHAFSAVLICGDAFDSARPFKKDKEYFYNIVKSHPSVSFFYLRGNHDLGQSYTEVLPNLYTFSKEWKYYNIGGVTVAGAELCADNARSLYSTLRLDPARTNVVMLHGQTAESEGADNINLSRLRGKNIDYLALGHVHSCRGGRLDDRGSWAYSGCLEGRGFDEVGEKGFITLELSHPVKSAFVPFAARTVREVEADITSCPDWLAAARLVRAAMPRSPKDMFRVILKGEASFDTSDLAEDIKKELEPLCFAVSVKDQTRMLTDVSALMGDNTIRGQFVRAVLASDETEDNKSRIISAGLKAFAGRGDEL